MKMRIEKFLFYSFIFISHYSFAAQLQTYPTSATTQIRFDTYVDDLETIAHSTWTVDMSTWQYFNGGTYWSLKSAGSASPQISLLKWDGSTTTVNVSMSVNDYSAMIAEESRTETIKDIARLNMYEYMVMLGTTDVPSDWNGWCSEIINKNMVPVKCP